MKKLRDWWKKDGKEIFTPQLLLYGALVIIATAIYFLSLRHFK